MTPELAACVLEGLLLLHEELSVEHEAPWSVGTPDQKQVSHDEFGWSPVSSLTAPAPRWWRLGTTPAAQCCCRSSAPERW